MGTRTSKVSKEEARTGAAQSRIEPLESLQARVSWREELLWRGGGGGGTAMGEEGGALFECCLFPCLSWSGIAPLQDWRSRHLGIPTLQYSRVQ